MDRARWANAAVVAVVCFVTVACLVLALSHFFVAFLLNFFRHGDTPPAIREATTLLVFAGLAYLVAAGWVVYDRALRTPTPFVVLGAVLAVAAVLAAWAQSRLRQLPDQASLPPWFLSLGITCVLLALVAAWLRYRPSAVLAVATIIAIVAACAAIVWILVLTARSNAGREPFPAGRIEPRSTVPDGRLRAARLERSAAGDPAWFVVAEPVDADVPRAGAAL